MKGKATVHWFNLTSAEAAALREAAASRLAGETDDLRAAHVRNLQTAWTAISRPAATGDRVVVVLTPCEAVQLSYAAGNTTRADADVDDPTSAIMAVFAGDKRRARSALAAHAKLDAAIGAVNGFKVSR